MKAIPLGRFIGPIFLLTFFLLSCGDDGSGVNSFEQTPETSLLVDDANSSSSVDVLPSSAMVNESSSSENLDESSSSAEPSSLEKKELLSSSAEKEKSSSFEVLDESSSSMKNENSSSSVKTAESSSAEIFEESSSSSVVEFSSSVAESSSSSFEIDIGFSSSVASSSSQQSAVLDSSYYNAEENTLTDLRDGQIYKTVLIGNQIWMAQNLRIEKYGDLTIKSYCYEDNPQNCDSIGRLYIRSAAFDSVGVFGSSGKGCGKNKTACSLKKPARGICPQNWHIADSLEWVELFNEVEKNALNLMATQGWDESCYENPTNGIYGFNALPGYRGSTGKYSEWASYFWVAERNVRSFSLSCYWKSSLPIIGVDTPESAFSVRCIKDSE